MWTIRLSGMAIQHFFEKFVTSSEICKILSSGSVTQHFHYRLHTPPDLMLYKMDNSYYVLKKWIQNCVNTGKRLKALAWKKLHIESSSAMGMTIMIEHSCTIALCFYHRRSQLYSHDLRWLRVVIVAKTSASEFEHSRVMWLLSSKPMQPEWVFFFRAAVSVKYWDQSWRHSFYSRNL